MVAAPARKRAIAFMDGQNLFHASREAFGYLYPNYNAAPLAAAVCQHWGIENSLPGVLAGAFHEERMRQRERSAIANLALLNRLAVSMLRQEKSVKAGVQCKRKRAGWDNDYLLHILCTNT